MFTGIIETVGQIENTDIRGNYRVITIKPKTPFSFVAPGESISVDGCCLTVIRHDENEFAVEASPESVSTTIIGYYTKRSEVNLERALLPTSRLGGHFVTGHVDTVGIIDSLRKDGNTLELWARYPEDFTDLLVAKGSIALNGISLTANEVNGNLFSANLIPYTRNMTTIDMLKRGSRVNLEFDIVGKYIVKLITKRNKKSLTIDKLINSGW